MNSSVISIGTRDVIVIVTNQIQPVFNSREKIITYYLLQ